MGDRIRAARLTRGLSLRAVAQKVGVSHQAIYKYERNEDVPSSAVLMSLSEVLGVKPEFFFRADRPLDIAPVFRKHPRLSARAEKMILSSTKEWLERYLEVETLIPSVEPADFPPAMEIGRVDSLDDLETLAERLRDAWELGTGPASSLMEVLEDKGIRVGTIQSGDDAFDACGFWVKVAEDAAVQGQAERAFGSAAIVIREGVPGDRQRFSMAHELGHLLLQWLGGAVSADVSVEAAANRFAGAFLVSREAAYRELGQRRHNINLAELHLLKLKYGFSMQAWLRRALELDIISDDLETRLFRELKSLGAPKVEPWEPVPSEEPGRLKRMAWRAVAEGVVTRSKASELAGIQM